MSRISRTRPEVAKILESALATGGDSDFDDFVSIEIAEPELESVRRECLHVTLAPKEAFEATIRRLLAPLQDQYSFINSLISTSPQQPQTMSSPLSCA